MSFSIFQSHQICKVYFLAQVKYLTFGRDFAFVGNQYKLEVYGVEHFPDLIFFNRELNALVVIELKKGTFKSSYLGQLCTYLRLIDDQMRKPHENPSIGIKQALPDTEELKKLL
ncbi:MAG: DUF1016 family protein [Bacteroidetes bacterium]|uniref:DUF1016 family protein n=1 Tax=Candidatus Cryptobacteroides gallistercoris TaxID=2840765 RepID=A0A940DNA4_9BACT|nr:DUF1016 family protein [Candidatus Cryptobacteroides gallistercoris]